VDLGLDYARADEQSPVTSTIALAGSGAVDGPGAFFAGLLYNNLIGDPAPCTVPTSPAPFCGVPGLIGLPTLPADTPRYDGRFLSGDPTRSFATGPSGSRYEQLALRAAVAWHIGAIELKATTGVSGLRGRFGRDPDGAPITLIHTIDRTRQRQFSQEFQLTRTGDRVTWIAGLYYFRERAIDRIVAPFAQETFDIVNRLGRGCTLYPAITGLPEPIAVPVCPNIFSIDASAGAVASSSGVAAYAEASVEILPHLTLTGGGRYTRDRKHIDLTGYLVGGVPLTADPAAARHFSSFDPRVTLSFRPDSRWMLYGSGATGFKSGGYNLRYGAPIATGPTAFDPERVLSAEIGAKYRSESGRLTANVALFDASYRDIQLVVFDNAIPRTVNAARARVRGIEAELRFAPVRWLALDANYGFLDARYTRISPAIIGSFGVPIVNPIRRGNRFVDAPRHSLNVSVEAALWSADDDRLSLRVDLSRRSAAAKDAVNTPELIQPPLTLLGARLTLAHGDGMKLALVRHQPHRSRLHRHRGGGRLWLRPRRDQSGEAARMGT